MDGALARTRERGLAHADALIAEGSRAGVSDAELTVRIAPSVGSFDRRNGTRWAGTTIPSSPTNS
jgi:hypothetical protein